MKVRTSEVAAAGAPANAAQLEKAAACLAPAASVIGGDVQVGAQAARVQVAQSQLAAMPDIDAARVAEIKAALARGEINFDPKKIAGLVMRHHGGR